MKHCRETMKMTSVFFFAFVFFVLNSQAQTNQAEGCRYPLRSFGNAAVNLAPLFQWWTQRAADSRASNDVRLADSRPMSAWHRITGTKVGELQYSWVVNARIYTSPGSFTNARIILKNPPATEEQSFYVLKNELAAATQQMTNDQRKYQADTQEAQRAAARVHAIESSRSWKAPPTGEITRAAKDKQAAAAALLDQQQLEQMIAQAETQLQTIPSKDGRYFIDWFALKIGSDKSGAPIYDLGVVNGAP